MNLNNVNDLKKIVDEYIRNKTNKYELNELYSHPNPKKTLSWQDGSWFETLEKYKYYNSIDNFELVSSEVEDLLKQNFKSFNNEDFELTAKHLNYRYIQSYEYLIKNIANEVYTLRTNPIENSPFKNIVSQDNTIKNIGLEEAFKQFLNNTEIESKWDTKTIDEYNLILKLLVMFFSRDYDIAKIDKKCLTDLRNLITKLPKKWSDTPQLKGLTLDEIIKCDRIKLSSSTVNKYIARIERFFKYCYAHGYVDKNYAEGLKIKRDTHTKARTSFTVDELSELFATKFFNQDFEKSCSKKFEHILITIIALYSGMRLGEIVQLTINDIKVEKDIYYFDVNNENEKSVKTSSSIRKVPIHSKIIDMGFINYIDFIRQNNLNSIWGDITSRKISDWFGTLKKYHLSVGKTKVFHSFRHNFADSLKQDLNERDIVSELLGHSYEDGSRLTYSIYANKYDLDILNKVLQKCNYEIKELDILLEKIKQYITKKYL